MCALSSIVVAGAMGLDTCDKDDGLEGMFGVALARTNWELWGVTGGNGAEFGVGPSISGLDTMRGEGVFCAEVLIPRAWAFAVLTQRLCRGWD